jgi:putative PIN family toxin of toxin-antitoxin system
LRAVLDPNVIISGLLSPEGSPARTLLAWQQSEFELVASPLLLAELERALSYPKLRRRIPTDEAQAVLEWLARSATIMPDPEGPPPVRSVDPGDDYLLALASSESAVLVSGDDHLLSLSGELPIHSPASFLALLEQEPQ